MICLNHQVIDIGSDVFLIRCISFPKRKSFRDFENFKLTNTTQWSVGVQSRLL